MKEKGTHLLGRALNPHRKHQLNVNQRHVHLIEIKYSEDTRPGQQLEAAQRQHANLCKLISAKIVTLHNITGAAGYDFGSDIK
eukprot:834758-Pelagomonas_calceolata.AAC.3